MAKVDNPSVELVEESFQVEKKRTVSGSVRVSTHSESIEELFHASIASERVEVTREPIGREVTDIPQMRVEGNLTIIPVFEEIVVVEKRLLLVEEIRVRRIETTDEVTIPVTLRKQHATVERQSNENPNEEKLS